MKVYGLPSGQGLDHRNNISRDEGKGQSFRWSRPWPKGSPKTFIVPEA